MNRLNARREASAGGNVGLGSPVSGALLDRVVGILRKGAERVQGVLSVQRGKSPGEVVFWTSLGQTRIRVVEEDGKLVFISLPAGRVTRRVDKAQFVGGAMGALR